jgi:hypothetical protein
MALAALRVHIAPHTPRQPVTSGHINVVISLGPQVGDACAAAVRCQLTPPLLSLPPGRACHVCHAHVLPPPSPPPKPIQVSLLPSQNFQDGFIPSPVATARAVGARQRPDAGRLHMGATWLPSNQDRPPRPIPCCIVCVLSSPRPHPGRVQAAHLTRPRAACEPPAARGWAAVLRRARQVGGPGRALHTRPGREVSPL